MKYPIYCSFTVLLSTLLISCGGGSGSASDSSDADLGNDPTVAVNAGADLSVDEGEVVVLSGSVSDASGTPEIFWEQVSGPEVDIDDESTLSPEVELPRVPEDTNAVLRLTVVDNGVEVSDELTIAIENTQNGPDGPSPQGIRDNDRGDRRDRDDEDRGFNDDREVRTYDGSNNNLDNPDWGAAFAHLQRLGEADYTDGVSSLAGLVRPSARLVSNEVVNQDEGVSVPNSFGHTDMLWQWGQFIDHDIDLTDGAEESANISVPVSDPFFDPQGSGTVEIPFSRALFDPTTGTSADNPREQENEITSWIDGSMIYGSDAERAAALRVGENSPFLATSDNNMMPFNTEELANANGFIQDPTSLFLAGDVRANEQIGLAVMHTLWVREHNRIARNLVNADFSNDPEVVFQQARRLVVAKLQKITYDEFLPALLGNNAIPNYNGYDDSLNPTIYNEFSVAAYRFGHSLVNEQILRLDDDGDEINGGHLSLREAFFTAPMILTQENSLDPILRGLATQSHQTLDTMVIQDLRSFLFGAPGDGGLDLPALNIQRGRDHGVPSYNDMREVMGLDRYSQISQITSDIDLQVRLSEAYGGDIDQIDLWVGGLAEDAVDDSQFGELFYEIIRRQFLELRDGDRFWYERYLTNDELQAIENVTLAEVIRDNTGIGNELQDDVFSTP